jgi:hypothetical protein
MKLGALVEGHGEHTARTAPSDDSRWLSPQPTVPITTSTSTTRMATIPHTSHEPRAANHEGGHDARVVTQLFVA